MLLALIRQLYDLEDRAKLWSAEQRLELRQREAVRVLKQIRAPTRSSWSGQEELVAHWQLGGGSSRGELNDNHQHGRPQRSGRV